MTNQERLTNHWKGVPPRQVGLAIKDGGLTPIYRCPDERCGEGDLFSLIPHPDDPSQTPNRCPTCLATAVETPAFDENHPKEDR